MRDVLRFTVTNVAGRPVALSVPGLLFPSPHRPVLARTKSRRLNRLQLSGVDGLPHGVAEGQTLNLDWDFDQVNRQLAGMGFRGALAVIGFFSDVTKREYRSKPFTITVRPETSL